MDTTAKTENILEVLNLCGEEIKKDKAYIFHLKHEISRLQDANRELKMVIKHLETELGAMENKDVSEQSDSPRTICSDIPCAEPQRFTKGEGTCASEGKWNCESEQLQTCADPGCVDG